MKLSTLTQILNEKRLFARKGTLNDDTDFFTEWNDGSECFSVIGSQTGHVYACRPKRQAERLARQLKMVKKVKK